MNKEYQGDISAISSNELMKDTDLMNKVIVVKRTKNIDDLTKIQLLMRKYFKPHEIVSSNEFLYYVENYNKLYEGEDYFVYKIEQDDMLIGMMSGVKLNEFVVVDYFIIDAPYRRSSKEIANKVIDVLKEFNRPVVVEAESEVLCRLYQMFGFRRFREPYKYFMLDVCLQSKTSKVSSYDSNLLYLSPNDMDFEDTRHTLYNKHYMRWNSIYGDELTKEYKTALDL